MCLLYTRLCAKSFTYSELFFELDVTQMLQMSMITNPIDQTVRTEITLHPDFKASVLATALCSVLLSEKSEWGEKLNEEACKIPS